MRSRVKLFVRSLAAQSRLWETTLMQTSPKPPQRLEDRKAQKLMERIEKQKLQEKAPAPKQCPSAA